MSSDDQPNSSFPTEGGSLAARLGTQAEYEHETRIRNAYAACLADERPGELLLKTEHEYETEAGRTLRGDMKTLDEHDVLRIWEFKICADYSALGQILVYVALARKKLAFQRIVRGVIAAFQFPPEVAETIELLNLNIERVDLPAKYRLAGKVPPDGMRIAPPVLPTAPDKTER
jgi:hypothetical protein